MEPQPADDDKGRVYVTEKNKCANDCGRRKFHKDTDELCLCCYYAKKPITITPTVVAPTKDDRQKSFFRN